MDLPTAPTDPRGPNASSSTRHPRRRHAVPRVTTWVRSRPRCRERGATSVGLCCTEFGLLLSEDDDAAFIDSTMAHVRALLAAVAVACGSLRLDQIDRVRVDLLANLLSCSSNVRDVVGEEYGARPWPVRALGGCEPPREARCAEPGNA